MLALSVQKVRHHQRGLPNAKLHKKLARMATISRTMELAKYVPKALFVSMQKCKDVLWGPIKTSLERHSACLVSLDASGLRQGLILAMSV